MSYRCLRPAACQGGKTRTGRIHRTWVGVALAVALSVSACGTRLTSSQAQQQLSTLSAAGGAGGSLAAGGTASSNSAGADRSSSQSGSVTAPGVGGTGSSAGSAAAISGNAPAAVGGSASSPASASGGVAPGATKAPIAIGMNCDCSGVVGAAFAPARDSYQAWVQATNASGGIDGHPIKLLYADDNNSASQDLENVKTFVEQDHVIALVNLFASGGALGPLAQYLVQKHIPVVGGSGYEAEWTQYPVMFSTATADAAQDYSWAAEMKNAGKKVVGAIFCTEAAVCSDKEAKWKQFAQQLGLQVAYEGKESLAAPSFSSDCINAKSKGVEALIPVMDGGSSARIARDCNQQGYNPLLVVSQPFDNPPSYMNGAVAPLGSFPWFLTSGTPALDAYGSALKRYVRNPTGSYSALGWANAKLLEKALAGHVSDVPTPDDVFAGLWSLHGESLGGLTAPLTFTKGQNSAPVLCSFRAAVKNGTWVAPNGMQLGDCQP